MYEEILKIIVAILLGGIIGIERKKHHKPTGFRTLALVSLGACLATILALNHFPNDTGRVIAGILTGIGFLGAGAIISVGKDVVGLTTAASIWATAIIGMVIGMGDYVLAVISVLIALLLLDFNIFWNKLKK